MGLVSGDFVRGLFYQVDYVDCEWDVSLVFCGYDAVTRSYLAVSWIWGWT